MIDRRLQTNMPRRTCGKDCSSDRVAITFPLVFIYLSVTNEPLDISTTSKLNYSADEKLPTALTASLRNALLVHTAASETISLQLRLPFFLVTVIFPCFLVDLAKLLLYGA